MLTLRSGRVTALVFGLAVLLLAAMVTLFLMQQSTTPADTTSYFRPNTLTTPIASTTNATLYCRTYKDTESPCKLFTTLAGSEPRPLDYAVDAPSEAVLVSPDRHHLLIIEETEAVVLSGDTLEKELDVRAPSGDEFGTYDALPSFVPSGHWTSNTEFDLSVFPIGTPDPSDIDATVTPIKIEHFTIGDH